MEYNKVKVVNLHENLHLMEQTASLINSEWPRSMGARLRSLETKMQFEGFPVSILIVTESCGDGEAEKVIGHSKAMLILHSKDRSCFVETVVVAKNLRGKGYGKLLMESTEEYAKRHGVENVYLTTQNEEKFYTKLGYELCPPIIFCGSQSSGIQEKFERLDLFSKVENSEGSEQTKILDNFKTSVSTVSSTTIDAAKSFISTTVPPPPPPPMVTSSKVLAQNVPNKVYMKKTLH